MSGIPVDRCPYCEEEGLDVRGKIDGRLKLGGRYVYTCEMDSSHRWQNADEAPSDKGFTPLSRPRR